MNPYRDMPETEMRELFTWWHLAGALAIGLGVGACIVGIGHEIHKPAQSSPPDPPKLSAEKPKPCEDYTYPVVTRDVHYCNPGQTLSLDYLGGPYVVCRCEHKP